jgi:gamma-glutamylcyclotransferase (GGCT)/AIG2-like uncharacterized protein YtfP
MPLLFSYGMLQQDDVQLATLGRRLTGHRDELLKYEPSLVQIEDPAVAIATGNTHHANVTFNNNDGSRVPGTVFEITDDDLGRIDAYESVFEYTRVVAGLASGREAWVYVHAL